MAKKRCPALFGQPAEDDTGVCPAKSKRIGEDNVDLPFVGLVRHKIDCRLDRWIVEINSRRDDLITHCEQAKDRLDRASRAEQVTN